MLQGPAGVLYVTLSLVPTPVPYASPVSVEELDGLLKSELQAASEAGRRFYVYAREWWNDFIAISPLMTGRWVSRAVWIGNHLAHTHS